MGKTLLVIGGSSDMAIGALKQLHSEYEKIAVHYRRMNDGLSALKEDLGDLITLYKADLADANETEGMIQKLREDGVAPSHILHFPAPPCLNQRFHKMGYEPFSQELDVSLRSAVMVAQAFLPQMVKARYGRVVFLLSFVLRDLPPKYCAQYVTSKYALLGLMRALAAEYAEKGITVNGVSPAWVMTKYLATQPEVLIEQNAKESPLGRNLVVEDLIPTIRYLLSDGAAAVTGQNIYVTGGR